jgi:stage III sporulation protein AF
MMAWLSDWLKQILAVLLLAAIVDLLVPGKAYERYTRLALGLIVLTAMLGPLLKLFQEDPERLLGRGFAGWIESAGASTRMPGLDEIRREADALRDRQDRQTARLAEQALETSIREAVNRLNGPKAREVKAEIANGAGGAEIVSVMVVLEAGRETEQAAAEEKGAAADEADGEDGDRTGGEIRIGPIEPVDPVDAVRVSIGAEGAVSAFGSEAGETGEAGRAPEGLKAAPAEAAAVIKAVVHQGWGVEPERITVWMPA